MKQINEIIEDSKFNDFLSVEITAYNLRPAPGKGFRYKRTSFDILKDEGKFNVDSIRSEFVKIENRESRLSSAIRDAITVIVFKAASKTVNFREKEAKAEELATKKVAELKKRTKKTTQHE